MVVFYYLGTIFIKKRNIFLVINTFSHINFFCFISVTQYLHTLHGKTEKNNKIFKFVKAIHSYNIFQLIILQQLKVTPITTKCQFIQFKTINSHYSSGTKCLSTRCDCEKREGKPVSFYKSFIMLPHIT